MKVLISQSMYFPWVGFLEQIKSADAIIHLNNVRFSKKGGFYRRVQIKTYQGPVWLSIPLKGYNSNQVLEEAKVDNNIDWRSKHRALLSNNYINAPFCSDMMQMVDEVFSLDSGFLVEFTKLSVDVLSSYFGLNEDKSTSFYDAKELCPFGTKSEGVLSLMKSIKGQDYITGHGALNYLDHDLFEREGIKTFYMDYQCHPYPQLYGDFLPFVSALDLVANCGPTGAAYIKPELKYWRDFIS